MMPDLDINAFSDFVDHWLRVQSSDDEQPGFVVNITHRGRQVYNNRFGISDQPEREASELVFNIGSIAKTMTAAIILKLIEDDRLSIDDYAVDHLAWLNYHSDLRVKQITIHHLLAHTAGLMREGDNSEFYLLNQPFPDYSQAKDTILRSTLVYDPGHRQKYSNLGYILLAMIAQSCSRQSYADLAHDLIITPCSLLKTTLDYEEAGSRMVQGHSAEINGVYHPLPKHIDLGAYQSTMGWFTTASELNKIMDYIFSGDGLLNETSQNQLISGLSAHWQPYNPKDTTYGIGTMTLPTALGDAIGHSGTYMGHRAGAYRSADGEYSVVVIGAQRESPVTQIIMGLFEVIDYFAQDNQLGDSVASGAYRNSLSCIYLRTGSSGGHSITLDTWSPMRQIEILRRSKPGEYTIEQTIDLMYPGESVGLIRGSDGQIKHINYAGQTLQPIEAFNAQLKDQGSPFA